MCTAHLRLLTSGRQDAPEPTTARPPTRVPLRCGLSSPVGASVRQAYYSYPEGVLSLLTGRHKYSSTSSPRVNGCPSGCSEPYRRTARACCRRAVWARLSQRQGRLRRGRNVESHACSQRKQLQVSALECNPKTLLPSGVLFIKVRKPVIVGEYHPESPQRPGNEPEAGFSGASVFPLFVPNATWPIRINLF